MSAKSCLTSEVEGSVLPRWPAASVVKQPSRRCEMRALKINHVIAGIVLVSIAVVAVVVQTSGDSGGTLLTFLPGRASGVGARSLDK